MCYAPRTLPLRTAQTYLRRGIGSRQPPPIQDVVGAPLFGGLTRLAAPRNHRAAPEWYEEYHPYGTTAWWASSSSTDVSQKRYRYTGKEKDEETGLYYHGARYYMPWLGRWTSADPIGVGDGVNRYAYVHGNPVRLHDPDGRRASLFVAMVRGLTGCGRRNDDPPPATQTSPESQGGAPKPPPTTGAESVSAPDRRLGSNDPATPLKVAVVRLQSDFVTNESANTLVGELLDYPSSEITVREPTLAGLSELEERPDVLILVGHGHGNVGSMVRDERNSSDVTADQLASTLIGAGISSSTGLQLLVVIACQAGLDDAQTDELASLVGVPTLAAKTRVGVGVNAGGDPIVHAMDSDAKQALTPEFMKDAMNLLSSPLGAHYEHIVDSTSTIFNAAIP